MDISLLEGHGSAPALLDPNHDQTLSFSDLAALSQKWRGELSQGGCKLLFIFSSSSVEEVALYIAAKAEKCVVIFLEKNLNLELRERLIAQYRPTHLFENQQLTFLNALSDLTIEEPHLGEIVQILMQEIPSEEKQRTITSLPLHDPFGLALLQAYLEMGRSTVLNSYSILEPEFWSLIQRTRCTTLTATPATCRLLYKIGFERFELPFLKTLIIAGKNLEQPLLERFQVVMCGRGGKVVVIEEDVAIAH